MPILCLVIKIRKKFICAQGPLEKTINDFWRMIWEQRVEVIAMVTGLEENGKCKCAKYWPESGDETYNNLIVSLIEELNYGDYTVRRFLVKSSSTENATTPIMPLDVTQFHYTAWRDFLAPDRPGGILKFMRRIGDVWKQPSSGPLLVHCSAGVGRSGTLITIDSLIDQLEEEGSINIYQTVVELRRHRNFMVQSLTQYIFIYRAIMELHQFGCTEVDTNRLQDHVHSLEEGDNALLQAEFNKLDEIVEDIKSTDVGSMDPNIVKNRYDYILPFDKNRVVLTSIPKEDSSTYINASLIQGCDRSTSYIISQDPLEVTIGDFWRMVHEHHVPVIVMLSSAVGIDKEECPVYWPEGEESNSFKHITVRLIKEDENEEFFKRNFMVSNILNGRDSPVTQLQFKNWPSSMVLPESIGQLLHLVKVVNEVMDEEKRFRNPILIHCSNGGERSSLFAVIHQLVGQFKKEKKVDVFHTVCNVRSERQFMIPTLDHYHFCYKVLIEYAKLEAANYE